MISLSVTGSLLINIYILYRTGVKEESEMISVSVPGSLLINIPVLNRICERERTTEP